MVFEARNGRLGASISVISYGNCLIFRENSGAANLAGNALMAVHCDQSRGGVVKTKGVRQPEDCAPVRFR